MIVFFSHEKASHRKQSVNFFTSCAARSPLVTYRVALGCWRSTDSTGAQKGDHERHSWIRTRSTQTPVGLEVRAGRQAPGEK